MEPSKVAMLAMSVGMYELTPKLQGLADKEEFWKKLEQTPEDKLDEDQREMLGALGARTPEQED